MLDEAMIARALLALACIVLILIVRILWEAGDFIEAKKLGHKLENRMMERELDAHERKKAGFHG